MEEVESAVLKNILTSTCTQEEFAQLLDAGFELNKNLLISLLSDAQLIADEWLVTVIKTLSKPDVFLTAVSSCLRQLFSNGHLPDLRLGVYLIKTFNVNETIVLDCLKAKELDHEMFYMLRKFDLPMKTLFGLRFKGIPDEFWSSLLELYTVDHEILQICFHDVVIGGSVDQFDILNMFKSTAVLGSVGKILNWNKQRQIPPLSTTLENASVRSCNSFLSVGMKITPTIIKDLSRMVFDSAPTKRFIYILAQIEKTLWDNQESLDDWLDSFESLVLQDPRWIAILNNHTEVFLDEPMSPISLKTLHYDNESDNDLELDDLEVDDNASVASGYSAASSTISNSIINAYSVVKNSAVNYARDNKYKDLRRFYYAVDQLVTVLERKKLDKIRNDLETLSIDNLPHATKSLCIPVQSEMVLKDGTIVMKPLDENGVSFEEMPFNQWYCELKEKEAKIVTKRASLTKYFNRESLTHNSVLSYFGKQ